MSCTAAGHQEVMRSLDFTFRKVQEHMVLMGVRGPGPSDGEVGHMKPDLTAGSVQSWDLVGL